MPADVPVVSRLGLRKRMERWIGGTGVRPLIGIDPQTATANQFINRFSEAVMQSGADLVSYSPALRNLVGVRAVILHWPNHFLGHGQLHRAIYDLARLRIARRLFGTRLIWVAHNVMPHEVDDCRFSVANAFVRALDGVIYLSEASRQAVRAHHRLPRNVAELVTVHGAYEGADATPIEPPLPDAPVRLASFGLLRPYKNHDELIAAMAPMSAGAVGLTIAGRIDDTAYVDNLRRLSAGMPAVTIDARPDLLSPEDLDALIDDAHGIVLPYRNILNSGAAIHALSRGRPVLIPSMGSMPELQALVGDPWITLYDGTLTASHIERFADAIRSLDHGASPDLSALSWARVERDLTQWLPTVLRR